MSFEIIQHKPAEVLTPCVFEDIYFGHTTSTNAHGQSHSRFRQRLGYNLASAVYEQIKELDPSNLIIVPVPNTARTVARGLDDGLREILSRQEGQPKAVKYDEGLLKLTNFRIFIAHSGIREAKTATAFVYDPEVIEGKDVIVVEDSLVRGLTLRERAIETLEEAGAKSIHAAMSCPHIYQICPYGIDFATYQQLMVYRVLKEFMTSEQKTHFYDIAKAQEQEVRPENVVVQIYKLFDPQEISNRMAKQLGTDSITFQTMDGLREAVGDGKTICCACLNGDYPTDAGARVANRAYILDFEGKNQVRSHEVSR
ncbi:MAG: phosphoribosyltransferase family protein [Candidatus Woesearchaeota archaeon]|jgi:amidophosphoribosyltransferase|nr:phosphoribosyltransferase family protein [Candidatus Woesearchaeota archaeon]MDP7458085.1 phosphoribosyltransferase family protein [Candidatus Woesearchaeota archaeon]